MSASICYYNYGHEWEEFKLTHLHAEGPYLLLRCKKCGILRALEKQDEIP